MALEGYFPFAKKEERGPVRLSVIPADNGKFLFSAESGDGVEHTDKTPYTRTKLLTLAGEFTEEVRDKRGYKFDNGPEDLVKKLI